jgi:hypothetical protein
MQTLTLWGLSGKGTGGYVYRWTDRVGTAEASRRRQTADTEVGDLPAGYGNTVGPAQARCN